MISRHSRRIAPLLIWLAFALGCGSGPHAKHLVLVTVDTLRADRIGAYGYERARTPVLDSLAAESIRFDRAYSHASLTLPAAASLLTGRLHTDHGVYHNQSGLAEEVRTLAEILEREGFATAAFIGSYVLRPGRGLERGFDTYTQAFVSKELLRKIPENPAGFLSDEAVSWAGKQDPGKRLFLWVHYQEPHGPYTPPDYEKPEGADAEPEIPRSESQSGRNAIPRYQWLGHGRLSEYQRRYDAEISEVDWFMGVLERGLREKGVLDDSMLVFTADHGEAFGEDDLYCAHGEGLDDSLLRVPLLVKIPNVPSAVRTDAVRLIDVAPTALEVLGVRSDALPGDSLLRDTGDRRLVAQAVNVLLGRLWRGLREDGFEIVEEMRGATTIRSLGAPADEVPAEVEARLAAELDRVSPWPPMYTVPMSLKEKEALRALGYAE